MSSFYAVNTWFRRLYGLNQTWFRVRRGLTPLQENTLFLLIKQVDLSKIEETLYEFKDGQGGGIFSSRLGTKQQDKKRE